MTEGMRPSARVMIGGLLLAAAAALSMQIWIRQLPPALWPQAVWSPAAGNLREIVFHDSILPRVAVACLSGAMLGLAGAIFQQILRNPLADPTTLGVSSGAQLALAAATIWMPAWLGSVGRGAVALAGGGCAALLVVGLAARSRLSSSALVLVGLVVGLYCAGAGIAVILLNEQFMSGLFIWGAGSLTQIDWQPATILAGSFAVLVVPTMLVIRPVTLFGLEDDGARSLGLDPVLIRLVALALAVALTAIVVSYVGVISFVGLAATTLARLLGARRLRSQMLWASIFGAALLWLTDELVQLVPGTGGITLPTGIATALIGGPVMLWLLTRGRDGAIQPRSEPGHTSVYRSPRFLLVLGLAVLVMFVWIALDLGQGPDGWHLSSVGELEALWRWRAPRTIAAAAAGILLGLAGVLMQRLTRNALASPEVIGVSSGAIFAVVVLLLAVPVPGPVLPVGAAVCGAVLVLILLLFLAGHPSFTPERLILTGIVISVLFQALVAALMASGSPQRGLLLSWMSGSTYAVHMPAAIAAGAMMIVMLCSMLMIARWLAILPLGDGTVQALGIDLPLVRFVVLGLAALATAAGTMIVGPLTFVGLMAPHLARLLGLVRPVPQLLGAAISAALIMIAADWIGRMVLFPREMPAGLVASLIGCPFFIALMWRRAA